MPILNVKCALSFGRLINVKIEKHDKRVSRKIGDWGNTMGVSRLKAVFGKGSKIFMFS